MVTPCVLIHDLLLHMPTLQTCRPSACKTQASSKHYTNGHHNICPACGMKKSRKKRVWEALERHSRACLGALCTLQHIPSIVQGCTIGELAIDCHYDVSSLKPSPVSWAARGRGHHLQSGAPMSHYCPSPCLHTSIDLEKRVGVYFVRTK